MAKKVRKSPAQLLFKGCTAWPCGQRADSRPSQILELTVAKDFIDENVRIPGQAPKRKRPAHPQNTGVFNSLHVEQPARFVPSLVLGSAAHLPASRASSPCAEMLAGAPPSDGAAGICAGAGEQTRRGLYHAQFTINRHAVSARWCPPP